MNVGKEVPSLSESKRPVVPAEGTSCSKAAEPEGRAENIWADPLRGTPIGPHDDFFELGGQFLLATRLASEIERVFKGAGEQAGFHRTFRDRITEVQKGNGSRPPFFMIHSDPLYATLPRLLGSDQPFYGVQGRALEEHGRGWLLKPSVKRRMTMYTEAIRSVAPHGPYLIGGFGSAAMAAFEVARQLREAGEPVPLLVMIDAVGNLPETGDARSAAALGEGASGLEDTWPGRTASTWRQSARVHKLAAEGRCASKKFGTLSRTQALTYFIDLAVVKLQNLSTKVSNWRRTKLSKLSQRFGMPVPGSLSLKLAGVRGVHQESARAYAPASPASFDGDIAVFLPSERSAGPHAGVDAWATSTSGEVLLTRLEGDHETAFILPGLNAFGEQLRHALDGAIQKWAALCVPAPASEEKALPASVS